MAMTEDEEAAFERVLDLIDEHIASPDREALHEMLRYWRIVVAAVEDLGLLSRSDLADPIEVEKG